MSPEITRPIRHVWSAGMLHGLLQRIARNDTTKHIYNHGLIDEVFKTYRGSSWTETKSLQDMTRNTTIKPHGAA